MNKLVRYDNVEYFMPFLFCNDIFIPVLHKLFENQKNPIKYVYGSPYCEWGIGARSAIFKLYNLNTIEAYLKKLKNEYNLIPAFTFTSLNAKDALNDEFSNNLLDIAYSLDSRFIVATEELFNHIKSRYPDAKMHCSVIWPSVKIIEESGFDETKFYNEMLDKCEVVVARPEYIKDNIDKLDKLFSDITRVEVLTNQRCHYNCPYHRQHYDLQAANDKNTEFLEIKRNNETLLSREAFDKCPKFTDGYRSVKFTEEEVVKAIEMGVKKIKLQGRSLTYSMLFNELCRVFFNQDCSKEDLKNKMDLICAEMIQENRKTALLLSL